MSPYAIVDDVIGLLEAERDNRHVVVRKTIPAGLPQLMAERPQLALAIVCLVMNAFEAMEAVTDRDRVLTISAELCDSDSLLVTFEDTGTGIDSDHKDRLFEAFFTTKAYHTGMGLTICRKIIEFPWRPALGRGTSSAWRGVLCKPAGHGRVGQSAGTLTAGSSAGSAVHEVLWEFYRPPF